LAFFLAAKHQNDIIKNPNYDDIQNFDFFVFGRFSHFSNYLAYEWGFPTFDRLSHF
jgi:hypothetical protein